MRTDLGHRTATVLTRRRLLGALLAAAGTALAAVWAGLALSRRARARPRRVSLAVPAADGVTFSGGVILVRRGPELSAFSARCPHLGCRVSRLDGEVLVCPCHGSRFDTRGRRLAGPAGEDLRALLLAEPRDGRVDVVVAS